MWIPVLRDGVVEVAYGCVSAPRYPRTQITYRISLEENVLKAEFGQEYADYAKKTKRLIPFLL